MSADLLRFNGTDAWDLPMAGTFLVDRSGTVRLAFVDPDFTRRLDPSVIVARLNELKGSWPISGSIHPSSEVAERAYELIQTERESWFTGEEHKELESYVVMEYLMELVKLEARRQLRPQTS